MSGKGAAERRYNTLSADAFNWSVLDDPMVLKTIEKMAHRVSIRFANAVAPEDLIQDAYLNTASNPKAWSAIVSGDFESYIENVLKDWARNVYRRAPISLDSLAEDKEDEY